jgi:HK97 family phage prohead protease
MSLNEAERRSVEVELRFAAGEGTKPGTLSGYAAVFNSLSSELGGGARRFRERISSGAFRAALEAGDNTFAYYHHGVSGGGGMGSAMPLGSTRDGSLRVKEDGHGLAFELDLPDTTDGRDLAALVARGTVRGVSFAFPSGGVKDTWQNEGGAMVRTIHQVPRLLDISPTHSPAYQDTSVAMRALTALEGEQEREAEDRRRRMHLAEIS